MRRNLTRLFSVSHSSVRGVGEVGVLGGKSLEFKACHVMLSV